MKTPTDILRVQGLRVVRGRAVILDGIDWRVERGQHWVILGANGSGKTSLLAALTAYLTPSAGTVELLGATFGRTDWRELRRRVGLVSSSIRQMIADDTTALEIVASGRDAVLNPSRPFPPAERHAALAVLRRVEAAPLAERPWGVLSQGERQRVLIGRALLPEPPLLILDEPCAGLDPVARERFVRFVDRLGKRRRGGPALVLVTHHVEEIGPAFTHALLLRAGRVLAAGEKTRVLTTARLSEAFGAPLRLRRDRHGGCTLRLAAAEQG